MSYGVEWILGPLVSVMVVLLIVPEFAAIAVVVVALAALVGLMALAAAALASPYLLVRSVRRRLPPRTNMIDPLAGQHLGADRPRDRLRVVGQAHVTAFAQDEPDEVGAIVEGATRDAA